MGDPPEHGLLNFEANILTLSPKLSRLQRTTLSTGRCPGG